MCSVRAIACVSRLFRGACACSIRTSSHGPGIFVHEDFDEVSSRLVMPRTTVRVYPFPLSCRESYQALSTRHDCLLKACTCGMVCVCSVVCGTWYQTLSTNAYGLSQTGHPVSRTQLAVFVVQPAAAQLPDTGQPRRLFRQRLWGVSSYLGLLSLVTSQRRLLHLACQSGNLPIPP